MIIWPRSESFLLVNIFTLSQHKVVALDVAVYEWDKSKASCQCTMQHTSEIQIHTNVLDYKA